MSGCKHSSESKGVSISMLVNGCPICTVQYVSALQAEVERLQAETEVIYSGWDVYVKAKELREGRNPFVSPEAVADVLDAINAIWKERRE